jgi:hypothetical protein
MALVFKDANGNWKIVGADEPLPVASGGGGGTPQVQVIAAALQNPGTGSTAPLEATQEFADGWQWGSYTQSRFCVAAGADQPGTLFLECSPDEGTTVFVVSQMDVAAGGWGELSTVMVGWPMMYRARYVNGPENQGKFVLARNATFA